MSCAPPPSVVSLQEAEAARVAAAAQAEAARKAAEAEAARKAAEAAAGLSLVCMPPPKHGMRRASLAWYPLAPPDSCYAQCVVYVRARTPTIRTLPLLSFRCCMSSHTSRRVHARVPYRCRPLCTHRAHCWCIPAGTFLLERCFLCTATCTQSVRSHSAPPSGPGTAAHALRWHTRRAPPPCPLRPPIPPSPRPSPCTPRTLGDTALTSHTISLLTAPRPRHRRACSTHRARPTGSPLRAPPP